VGRFVVRPARGKLLVILLAAAAVVGVALVRLAPAMDQPQPLAMSHQRHLAKDMKCRACHQGVEGQTLASFPTLADCMDCHKKQQGDNPSEPSVRAFALNHQDVAWVRHNHLPGHVYFSHAAHVTLANMECEDCHRDMSTLDQPVSQPDVHQDMEACVACHRQKQASVDCLTCHK
jgi:menaquinone reductase, multiheme cytochrome c subunit